MPDAKKEKKKKKSHNLDTSSKVNQIQLFPSPSRFSTWPHLCLSAFIFSCPPVVAAKLGGLTGIRIPAGDGDGVFISVWNHFSPMLPLAQDKPPCPTGFPAGTGQLGIGPPLVQGALRAHTCRPTVELPRDAGTVRACHSDASQPPGQLTLLQPWILGLFPWLTYTALPLKTTETLRGYPVPHWGHRNPLLPSKFCCHSYCAAPAP